MKQKQKQKQKAKANKTHTERLVLVCNKTKNMVIYMFHAACHAHK